MTIPTLIHLAAVASSLLGFISAWMLWQYGLPKVARRDGAGYIRLDQDDDDQIAVGRKYDRRARFAMGLLVGSFVLQLVVNTYVFVQPEFAAAASADAAGTNTQADIAAELKRREAASSPR
jgi:hypothetical protein